MRTANIFRLGIPITGIAFVAALLALPACSRTYLEGADEQSNPGSGGAGGAGGSSVQSSSSSASSSSGGGLCANDSDCDDGDACTSDSCGSGICAHGPRDDDNDGWEPLSCGGADCNDKNPNVNPNQQEDCKDAADNDCNGVADCFDPACKNVPDCGCKPNPNGENCNNNKDDDCDTTVDCNDADCLGTQACGCLQIETGFCLNGIDDDCDGNFDCDDPNCSISPECACQSDSEFCGDGEDNDCDLLIDCADPNCIGVFPCACQPPGFPEVCSDGIDNDCDTLPDCADPECLVSPACQMCSAEICNDSQDNNCNGAIDCADVACFFAPECAATPELCNNNLDDDNDTFTDCQDPDCANNPLCVIEQANCLSPKLIPGSGTYTGDTTGHISETKGSCGGDAGEAVFYFVLTDPSYVHLDSVGTSFDSTLYVRTGKCNSGKELGCDDDSGGVQWSAKLEFTILYPGTYYVFLDGYTVDPDLGPNEGFFALNVEITPNPIEKCNDKKDNDGDVYVDCADPDCTTVGACLNCVGGSPPSAEFGTQACTDGLDNDCDGTSDCDDEDCSASDYYITECCNGFDENDNQIPDDFNCRCASDADCDPGQICYTHTAHACGIPCEMYFGDICPFVAAGSYCNASTQQCEF